MQLIVTKVISSFKYFLGNVFEIWFIESIIAFLFMAPKLNISAEI